MSKLNRLRKREAILNDKLHSLKCDIFKEAKKEAMIENVRKSLNGIFGSSVGILTEISEATKVANPLLSQIKNGKQCIISVAQLETLQHYFKERNESRRT